MQSGLRFVLIVAAVISSLSFLGFMLMAAIQIPAFNMWFYHWQFGANDTYNVVNMQPDHLHYVTRHMLSYLRGRQDYLQIYAMVGDLYRPFFSEIELLHMVDVRAMSRLSITLRNIFALTFLASFVPFVLLRFKVKNGLAYLFKAWRYVSVGLFGLIGVLTIIISINWTRAWVFFHEISFSNEYWLLDPRHNLLINIVPHEFFFAMTVFIGVFFGLSLVILFLAGFFFKRLIPQRGGLRLP